MKVIGMRIKDPVKDVINGKMEMFMKENGKTTKEMALVQRFGITVISTLDSGQTIKEKVRGNLVGLMEAFMMEIGIIIKKIVMELIKEIMEIILKVIGKMTK